MCLYRHKLAVCLSVSKHIHSFHFLLHSLHSILRMPIPKLLVLLFIIINIKSTLIPPQPFFPSPCVCVVMLFLILYIKPPSLLFCFARGHHLHFFFGFRFSASVSSLLPFLVAAFCRHYLTNGQIASCLPLPAIHPFVQMLPSASVASSSSSSTVPPPPPAAAASSFSTFDHADECQQYFAISIEEPEAVEITRSSAGQRRHPPRPAQQSRTFASCFFRIFLSAILCVSSVRNLLLYTYLCKTNRCILTPLISTNFRHSRWPIHPAKCSFFREIPILNQNLLCFLSPSLPWPANQSEDKFPPEIVASFVASSTHPIFFHFFCSFSPVLMCPMSNEAFFLEWQYVFSG